MELILALRILWRRWWLVAIPVVITGVIVVPDIFNRGSAVSGGFATTLRYTAAQVLEALPERDGDFQDIWLASELTVNAFTDWVRSTGFAQEVAIEASLLGVDFDPAALSIAADNKRSVGEVFLSWPNAEELEIIAQAAILVLQTRNQDYFPQLGEAPAQVTLLDAPQVVSAPPPIANRFAPLIRIGLGLLAGLGLAYLADYLDPTLHDRDEVEKLGLSVVATIPRKRR